MTRSRQPHPRPTNLRLAILLALLAFCFFLAVIMTRVTS